MATIAVLDHPPPRKSFNWPLVKVIAWYVIVMPVTAAIYMTVVAEGFRLKFPFLAIPLFKLKWMPRFTERYDIFHRIDLAIPASIGLLLLVWMFWEHLLTLWITPAEFRVRSRQRPEIYKRVIITLGVALLLFDAYLFYTAVTFMGWGGKFSFTALVATVGYAACLIALALITINLRQDAKYFKEENPQ